AGGRTSSAKRDSAARPPTRSATVPAPGGRSAERGWHVAYFAVIYRYRPDDEALDEHRPAHRAFLRSLYQAGKLVVSGPLGGDADPAALLLFDGDCAD